MLLHYGSEFNYYRGSRRKIIVLDTAHSWNPLQLEGPTTYMKHCMLGILLSEYQVNAQDLEWLEWDTCLLAFDIFPALLFSE